MINILVVDDHKMFLEGIAGILENQEDMNIVQMCPTGEECYHFLKETSIDLVLLDIQLNTISGIEICQHIKQDYPHIKVLMLSMFKEESFINEAMKNGADGYILKNSGQDELLKAIRRVAEDGTYFSHEVSQVIMNSLRYEPNNKAKLVAPKISKREREVLRLILDEHTTREIAEKLFISLKTVETHRSNLLAKMGVRNIAGLVRKTLEFKMLD